jgi:uncharacterized protein GlcG (DUF336 family)
MSLTKSLGIFVTVAVVCLSLMAGPSAYAQGPEINIVFHKDKDSSGCGAVPNYASLKAALDTAVQAEATGLNLQMWATVVNRDGVVCAVAFSGKDRSAQWPGSRVISAQKANTANAFSLDSSSNSNGSGTGAAPLNSAGGLALSTANLYSAVQPGGSLFGLQLSNPVDPDTAYDGSPSDYGTASDPMVGYKVGGVNVFGGGLALYGAGKKLMGAVGLSGDTSCADHFIAWRVRNLLHLDHIAETFAVSGDAERPDNIVFDFAPNANGGPNSASAGGFGHPKCLFTGDPSSLPAVQP